MKRIVIISILMLAVSATGAMAQEKTGLNVKREGEPSSELEALMLARQLAEYGYKNTSAESLIVAAEILIENPTEEYEPVEEDDVDVVEENKTESSQVTLDPAKLLQDAKNMAAENDAMLALATQIENRIGEKSRDLVGLSKILKRRVNKRSRYTFTGRFRGGELAEVALEGDGDTDLDCYVYDEYGNLGDSDTDGTDTCYLRWIPKRTGKFDIVIKNLGYVYNEFVILIK